MFGFVHHDWSYDGLKWNRKINKGFQLYDKYYIELNLKEEKRIAKWRLKTNKRYKKFYKDDDSEFILKIIYIPLLIYKRNSI